MTFAKECDTLSCKKAQGEFSPHKHVKYSFGQCNLVRLFKLSLQVGVSFVSNNLLQKPRSCPDWIDIIIRECLKYQAEERPPAIALYDCLTCR